MSHATFSRALSHTEFYFQVITKILSTKPTLSLGNFEVQYLYNPKAVVAADEYVYFIGYREPNNFNGFHYRFRLALKKLSLLNKERNQNSEVKYNWLDPEFVPNSISI
jgi:arachidonate 5-lipoxygenase